MLVAFGGEHEHRHVAQSTNAFERLPAVEPRHVNVEHDEVGRRLLELRDALDAVARLDDLAVGVLEQERHQLADNLFVIDNKRERHARPRVPRQAQANRSSRGMGAPPRGTCPPPCSPGFAESGSL